ncbi:MAG: AAA family ATPase [Deltaproteobacteria bacterium]|nr:AAA family ATPase [Deltaproteobacteria bacterium]
MRCRGCNAELVSGAKFCHVCGTRVEAACPTCGAPIRPEFRFCPECGTALRSDAAAPPPAGTDPDAGASAPNAGTPSDRLGRLTRHIPRDLAQKIRGIQGTLAGERKLVTVLFCDLVGSTAIAERLDPEEYRDLLDQYLELAFHEIYRFEGIVNQLAGDGMMALFGAPVAHEDAPYRAVRAACEIRAALDAFNRQLGARRGFELRARIGIHTGPVVVGTVGNDLKMDYTAIGDTTNLAARLQSLAAPGSILASEATVRLVHGFFHLRAVEPFTVRGKSEPVTAYEVLGRSEITTALGAARARGLTPLVGREQELSQLADCFARVRGSLPQVVTVIGEAGSGKSRLLFEFREALAAEPVVFFEGRCSALKQKVPYSPFVVMLKQYFAISGNDPPEVACEKVAAKVRDFDPRLGAIHPFLCRMLSVSAAPPTDLPADEIKRETFHALADLVVRLSERTPVVMVIEDLHWIDDASRELLELSVAELARARVMMIFTHRPDFRAAWRAQVAFTQLSLRPLSQDEARTIIRAVADAPLPEDLEARILTKAEGSPFFTEEITRALLEEGYVVVTDGRAVLTRPIEEVLIPGTVREVIAARLDRLGGPAKRAIQVASVLGRQFRGAQLARLLEGEGIDVSAVLGVLENRGILHRKNVLSDDEFRFGESLTQEVAYDGLLLKERRQLHERIGLLLESEPGDGNAERFALLAHHFARSDNRRKALDTLLAAARHAESLPSYPTAIDLYRQAWEVGHSSLAEGAEVDDGFRRLVLRAALDLCRMAVVYVAPDALDVENAARVGRDLADALGDVQTAASFRAYHGMIAMSDSRERFAEGLALVESGYELAETNDLKDVSLGISRALAFSYLIDGQIERARKIAERLIDALERQGHRERLTDFYFGALWMRTLVAVFGADDPLPALQGTLAIHDLAVQANNRTARSGMAAVLAQLHYRRGEYAEAMRWADQSLEIAQVIGNVATLRAASAIALGARHELAEPFAPARYLKPIEDGFAMASNLSLDVGVIVDVLLGAGEVALAERVARLALDRAGGRLREMHARLALGDVLSRLGSEHHREAAECFEQAGAVAREVGLRSMAAHAHLGLGRLATWSADPIARDRHLRAAREVFAELGLRRHAERAERALTELDPALARSA